MNIQSQDLGASDVVKERGSSKLWGIGMWYKNYGEIMAGEAADGNVVKNHLRENYFPPIINQFDEHMIDFGEISLGSSPVHLEVMEAEEKDIWEGSGFGTDKNLRCFGGLVGRSLDLNLDMGLNGVGLLGLEGGLPTCPTRGSIYKGTHHCDGETLLIPGELGFLPAPS